MSPQAILAILIANLHRQSGGVSVRLCNDQYILSLYIANIRFDCQNRQSSCIAAKAGNDSNLLIVFYVQIMPDDFVMQLHRF